MDNETKEFGDAKASLGFSNMLREQMFLSENPVQQEEPTEGEVAEEVIDTGEPEMDFDAPIEEEVIEEPEEDPRDEKIAALEEELSTIRKDFKKEISKIREDVKEALNEED